MTIFSPQKKDQHHQMLCQPSFSLASAFLQQVMIALWLLHRTKLLNSSRMSVLLTHYRHDLRNQLKVVRASHLICFDLNWR